MQPTPKEAGATPMCDKMKAAGQWNTAWEPFFELDPTWTEEFIAAGDWVVVRGTQRAGHNGDSFEAPFAHLMKFADGKIIRGEFYGDSAKAEKVLA